VAALYNLIPPDTSSSPKFATRRMSSESLSGADLTLLVDRNIAYPEQVWYALAVFLFVVGCFQWGLSLHSKFARRRQHESDEETVSNHVHHKFSLRRIPLALINFYRVIAFRWTLEIGQTYTLNMAEIFVTLGYIALLLTYTYINSESSAHTRSNLRNPQCWITQPPPSKVRSLILNTGITAWPRLLPASFPLSRLSAQRTTSCLVGEMVMT
jgi:hypothetical protein